MVNQQGKFDKHSFPFCLRSIVDKFQHSKNSSDILYQTPSQVKWEPYNKLHVSNYKNVHYNEVGDVMVLQVNTRENTFVPVTQKKFNTDMLDLLTIAATEQQAHFASAGHSTIKGLDLDIDPNRAPKNFKGAMSRKDQQEWKLSTRNTEASRTATHSPTSSHPKEHCLQLLKSIYGTRQAAHRWHIHIQDWMEKNGHPAVNS